MTVPGLGLALDGERPAAVLVSAAGEIIARRVHDESVADPAGVAARLVTAILASQQDAVGSNPGAARPDRVVIATEAPLSALTNTSIPPARVGVLRIAAPATTSVPPLTGWPDALAELIRGPVAVVRGGHRYDGRELAELDLAAVAAFGGACAGTVDAIAVAGTDAHMNPDHELRALAVLREMLGGTVPIVTGHDVGGTGLLERENTAALGASVAPATQRFTDAVTSAFSEAGLDADLYLVTGEGTVVPASRAVRHPLALLGAAHAAARTGAARLRERDTLVVVESAGEYLRVSALLHGLPVQSGLLTEVAGVRTSIPEPRVVQLAAGGARVGLDEVVRRVRAQVRGAEMVEIGSTGTRGLPDGDRAGGHRTGGDRVDGEWAAALGAALGEASGSVDRVYFYGPRGLRECVDAARSEARELAVRRGADPRQLRVGEVREAPMTYVPVPCVRLRVTAIGPLAAAGTRAGTSA